MFRKYIEISSNMSIRKNEVLAIEKVAVMQDPKDGKEIPPVEKTRLTFINGKQLVSDVCYDEMKRLFL